MTILLTPAELRADDVEITGDAFRHHVRARRLVPGERVRVTDGEGDARWGEVAVVGRSSARIRLVAAAPPNEPAREVHVFVALPRPERAAWLVEKVAELGVRRVVFVTTERAPRHPGAGTLARLQRVADSALEQSQGSRRTHVAGLMSWPEALAEAATLPRRFVLEPEVGGRIAARTGEPCAVLIGPEGGWTPAESAAASAAGCVRVALGRRVLRVETAAVVAAALALTPP